MTSLEGIDFCVVLSKNIDSKYCSNTAGICLFNNISIETLVRVQLYGQIRTKFTLCDNIGNSMRFRS